MTDLFRSYFHYVKDTEPPLIFHRWTLISALGAFLGRQCWLPFGPQRIFPNQYIMLVGHPGSRKSTAIKIAKRLLSNSGYATFSAEKTSKEKFLLDMQGDDNATEAVSTLFGGGISSSMAREMYIVADEFNEFVGSGNIEFLSMLGALWDWDDPETPYKQRLKNSKSAAIYQPTINILAGNTYSGFAQAFPIDTLGQGFMSRLILIHSDPSGRKITIPTVPDATVLMALINDFTKVKESMNGPLSFSPEAYSALDTIYKTWPELEDNRFKHYSTRRLTHLIKLCIVVAASRCSMEIQVRDVILANTVLTFAELHMPKAMGELGRKKGSDASTVIMNVLYEAVEPMQVVDIFKKVSKDVDGLTQLATLIRDLQAADRIQSVNIIGTKSVGFLPKQRTIGRKNLFVDTALLKGAEL